MVSYPSVVDNVLRVTSAEVSEDSSLLAVGFADSIVKIWTLVPQKLRSMKSAEQLQDIDREAGKDFTLK
jgi:transcription initiation factor TFIID subunit 5